MTSLKTLVLPLSDRKPAEKLTDAGLAHLKSLTKLERLALDATNVTDAGLVHLAGLTDLRWLFLPDQITGDGLRHLGACKNLEVLCVGEGFGDLAGCHLSPYSIYAGYDAVGYHWLRTARPWR